MKQGRKIKNFTNHPGSSVLIGNEKNKLSVVSQKDDRVFGKDLKNQNKTNKNYDLAINNKKVHNVKSHIVIDQQKDVSENNSNSLIENSFIHNNSKLNISNNYNLTSRVNNNSTNDSLTQGILYDNQNYNKSKKVNYLKLQANKLPEQIAIKRNHNNYNHNNYNKNNHNVNKSLFDYYKKDEVKNESFIDNSICMGGGSNDIILKKRNKSENKLVHQNKSRNNSTSDSNFTRIHNNHVQQQQRATITSRNNTTVKQINRTGLISSNIKKLEKSNFKNNNLNIANNDTEDKTNPKCKSNVEYSLNTNIDNNSTLNKYVLTEMDKEFSRDIYYVTDYVLDIFKHLLETQVRKPF